MSEPGNNTDTSQGYSLSGSLVHRGRWLLRLLGRLWGAQIVLPFFLIWCIIWFTPALRPLWERTIGRLLNPETLGMIYIDTPEVYTRERLVNDRFLQVAWLNQQLERTDNIDKINTEFVNVEGRLAQRMNQKSEFRSEQKPQGNNKASDESHEISKGQDNHNEHENRAENSLPNDIRPSPIDLFRDAQAYRDDIRAELMRAQLDDRHDIEGNTLYRLNFDVTITPGNNTSASAIIMVKVEEDDRKYKLISNYDILQSDWHKYLQRVIDTAIAEQTIEIWHAAQHIDGIERVALQEFLRDIFLPTTLCEIIELIDRGAEGSQDKYIHECIKKEKFNQGYIKSLIESYFKSYHESVKQEIIDEYKIEFRKAAEHFRRVQTTAKKKDEQTICTLLFPSLLNEEEGNNNTAETNVSGRSCFDRGKNKNLEDDNDNWTHLMEACQLPLSGEIPASKSNIKIVWDTKNKLLLVDSNPSSEANQHFSMICPPSFSIQQHLLSSISMDKGFRFFKKKLEEDLQAPDLKRDTFVNSRSDLIDQIACLIMPRITKSDNESCLKKVPEELNKIFKKLEEETASEGLKGSFQTANTQDLLGWRLRVDQQDVRLFVAEYTKAKLNGEFNNHGYGVYHAIEKFFDAKVGGCEFNACTVVLTAHPKTSEEEEKVSIKQDKNDNCLWRANLINNPNVSRRAEDPIYGIDSVRTLMCALNDEIRTFSYAVTPSEAVQRLINEASTRGSLQAALHIAANTNSNAFDTVLSSLKDHESEVEFRHRNSIVVGFGFPPGVEPGKEETRFGWVIRPHLIPDSTLDGPDNGHIANYRQITKHYPLSAVVSVPSWWRSLKITVYKELTNPSTWNIERWSREGDDIMKCNNGNQNKENSDISCHYIEVPGSVEEVSEKLRYEVRSWPHLDKSTLNSEKRQALEIGRSGRVVLEGGRLWRSTVVTMGSQRADKIFVLPDMRGIIAEFFCVERPAGAIGEMDHTSEGSRQNHNKNKAFGEFVTVWTSEGRTSPLPVDLHSFSPRVVSIDENGKPIEDTPCLPLKSGG